MLKKHEKIFAQAWITIFEASKKINALKYLRKKNKYKIKDKSKIRKIEYWQNKINQSLKVIIKLIRMGYLDKKIDLDKYPIQYHVKKVINRNYFKLWFLSK